MRRGVTDGGSAERLTNSNISDLVLQHLDTWSAASDLLSPSALERLCGKEGPSRWRQAQLSVLHVIVATCHDDPVGFAAYKPGAVSVRVAHEFWVDASASCGSAPVAALLLARLERDALKSGCSKLFIVVLQATALRRILENHGYSLTLEGGDLTWFEKAIRMEPERGGRRR